MRCRGSLCAPSRWAGLMPNAVSAAIRSFVRLGVHVSATIHERLSCRAISVTTQPRTGEGIAHRGARKRPPSSADVDTAQRYRMTAAPGDKGELRVSSRARPASPRLREAFTFLSPVPAQSLRAGLTTWACDASLRAMHAPECTLTAAGGTRARTSEPVMALGDHTAADSAHASDSPRRGHHAPRRGADRNQMELRGSHRRRAPVRGDPRLCKSRAGPRGSARITQR